MMPRALLCAAYPIVVPANLAIVFGLIFHELTTNAAKYGALSRPARPDRRCMGDRSAAD